MIDPSDEKIVIKPSTELIADEYGHFKETTPNIDVHTFASKNSEDQQSAQLFVDILNENGYSVNENNLHCLETDDFDEIINTIYGASKDLGGLILFFSGVSTTQGMIRVCNGEGEIVDRSVQEMVTKFTSYRCMDLKNKPKIFIFHLKSPFSYSSIQVDGAQRNAFSYDLTYDTPAEADMLIVYKKTEKMDNMDFITKLCENIKEHGKVEDIISLVTYIESTNEESRPLLISTLTKKFYFTLSEYRGHHFHINEHHKQLIDHLQEINENLSQVKPTAKPKTTRSSKSSPASKRGPAVSSNGIIKKDSGTTARGSISTSKRSSLVETDSGLLKRNSRSVTNSSQGKLATTESDGGVPNKNKYTETRSSRLRMLSIRSDGVAKTSEARGSRTRLTSEKSETKTK